MLCFFRWHCEQKQPALWLANPPTLRAPGKSAMTTARAERTRRPQEERKRIFKEIGVRWSELNHLPYWDPVLRIVIDGMHNIFLGVTQFHFRKVIGMDVPAGDREDAGNSPKIKEKDLVSLRRLLLKDPEPRGLLRFNKATLGYMCAEIGLQLPRVVHEMKKLALANVLVCTRVDCSSRSTNLTSTDATYDSNCHTNSPLHFYTVNKYARCHRTRTRRSYRRGVHCRMRGRAPTRNRAHRQDVRRRHLGDTGFS